MPSKVWTLSALAVTALLALPNPIAAETVTCSYYSANYNSRRTANGQIFSNDALTAASLTLPFGTRVKLTNPKNGHSVVVRVNDRGPNVKGRDISVTRRAAVAWVCCMPEFCRSIWKQSIASLPYEGEVVTRESRGCGEKCDGQSGESDGAYG